MHLSQQLGVGQGFRNINESEVTTQRVQSTTWLKPERDFPVAIRITKLLDAVTGLQVSMIDPNREMYIEAEDFQIGLYGPGGLYFPHFDAFAIEDTVRIFLLLYTKL